ncbi:tetratricopeptide repeat protein 39A-like [Battus philenor]|uniref:tetratricopeptide repeat protein 39A-like n=1 Tax=Battus philenor TaxID=42288 RepID=UPI0035D0A71D
MKFCKMMTSRVLWSEADYQIGEIPHHAISTIMKLLPPIETLCLWSVLAARSGDRRATFCMLRLIDVERQRVTREGLPKSGALETKKAILAYLKGCCLAAIDMPREALRSLRQVTKWRIRKYNYKIRDHFLVPYAMLEEAMCYVHALGAGESAMDTVSFVWERYYGVSHEFRSICNMYHSMLLKRTRFY